MKRRIIKIITFILIFCMLMYCLVKLLWYPPSSISYFYKEPKNSLDVVYIGSSNVFIQFNTVLAYNLYGYTTGLLSTDAQPFVLTKYLIEESEKYQKPSLYIVDLAKVADVVDTFNDYGLRRTIDSMKFSQNRLDAIDEMLSYKSDIDKKEYINYYFSFFFYHNKWKRISKDNIIGNNDYYKGYLFDKERVAVEDIEFKKWINNREKLPEESEKVLNELIEYIRKNNINVLFTVPKRNFDEKINLSINEAIDIIKQNGLNVINFNTLEDFNNIDFSKDFYNEAHLNVYGATKFTLYFSKYLKENYNLENHRGDSNYSSWDKEYERLKQSYKNITGKEFEELLNNN